MTEQKAFDKWWKDHGQYCRSGGGQYEITFAYEAWKASGEQCIQMLAEQGHEYNKKTNAMIARHSERMEKALAQIKEVEAELAAWQGI